MQITVRPSTTDEDIQAVINGPKGSIFKLEGDYENLYERVQSLADGKVIEEILAGTDLYAEYGCNHLVKLS